MKRILLTLLIFSYPLLSMAQLVEAWKVADKLRLNSKDYINNVIEASNGVIYAVGYSSPGPLGKDDAFLIPIDSRSGNIQTPSGKPLYFGGRFDESFKALVQSNDGNIILFGYSGTNTKGKRDAWVVVVDAKGKPLWQQKFGTTDDDEFIDAIYDSETNTISTIGFKNNKRNGPVWVAQFRPEGDSIRMLNENTFGNRKYSNAVAITLSRDKKIVITGADTKDKVYLARLSSRLEPEAEQIFANPDANNEIVEDIITTQSGDYMIIGNTATKKDDENLWVVKVNKYMEESWQKNFGGRDSDAGYGIAEAQKGGFYLLGRSASQKSNDDNDDIYLIKIDASGNQLYRKYYGGSRSDIGKSVLRLNNGQLLIASETASDRAIKEDPHFIAYIDQEENLDLSSGVKESVRFNNQKNIQINTPDGLLKPQDRTSMAVTIHNQSNVTLPKVSIRIDNSGAKGVKFWQNNYLGTMAPQEKRVVHIPVEATQELESGKHDFNMTIMSGSAITLESSAFSVTGKKPEPAFIELVNYTPSLVRADRGQGGELEVKLNFKNTGDISASNAKFKIQMPSGLKADKPEAILGTMPGSMERSVSFKFTTKGYNRKDATINLQVIVAGQAQPGFIPIYIDNVANPSASSMKSSGDLIAWADKRVNNVQANKPINTSDPNFAVKVVMVSNKKVRTQDIKTYVNKNVVRGNKSFGEEELTSQPQTGGSYEYLYERKIQLKQGLNEVYLQYGETESRKVLINYQPRSRNLHVVAIGPSHPDLKYTSKDAKDFAKAFADQSGKLFNQVFVNELSSTENTEEGDIKKAMDRLKFQFQNGQIQPNDVVIVFISSHGIIGTGNSYKIIPSEFDPAFGDKYTIDYQRDILDVLNDVNCKKMIFVDACHSGAASSKGPLKDQRRSEMIFELNSQSPGLSSIVSCQSNEMSYEDEAWQNGAFTKAIIEGLNNTEIKTPDGNSYRASIDDDFITLGELYRFVRRRVLNLVSTYKPDAPTNQTPKLIQATNEGLSEDIPIFEVTNNN